MLGSILLFALGLVVAGIVPPPDFLLNLILSPFWGDWGDFLRKYSVDLWWQEWRPWIGAGMMALAVWSLRPVLLLPLRYAYWLRWFFGKRVFGSARWARPSSGMRKKPLRDIYRAANAPMPSMTL